MRAVVPQGSSGETLALQRDVEQVVLRVDDGEGNAAETRATAILVGELPKAISFNG